MAVDPGQVSAVIVTRGDVDLEPCLEPIRAAGITDIVIWNNAERDTDLKVYGRYAAIAEVKNEFIYTQDDDAICPVAAILADFADQTACPDCDGDGDLPRGMCEWCGGTGLVDKHNTFSELLVNVPPGEKPWVAWGGVFHRDLPADAFADYLKQHRYDTEFLLWADVVFAHLTGWRSIDLGHEDLPHAFAPDRMYRQPTHYIDQGRVRERSEALAKALKGAA